MALRGSIKKTEQNDKICSKGLSKMGESEAAIQKGGLVKKNTDLGYIKCTIPTLRFGDVGRVNMYQFTFQCSLFDDSKLVHNFGHSILLRTNFS